MLSVQIFALGFVAGVLFLFVKGLITRKLRPDPSPPQDPRNAFESERTMGIEIHNTSDHLGFVCIDADLANLATPTGIFLNDQWEPDQQRVTDQFPLPPGDTLLLTGKATLAHESLSLRFMQDADPSRSTGQLDFRDGSWDVTLTDDNDGAFVAVIKNKAD